MMTAEERLRRIDRLCGQQYYQAHKERCREYHREYISKHPEKRRAYCRKFYAANAQKLTAYYRARRDRLRHETTFGAFLKRQGIPQWEAADRLGVSPATVSNWANGITVPKEGKILAVWPEYGGVCSDNA